jgi:RNA polymerase sigma-70 factor (ECF subfamily)
MTTETDLGQRFVSEAVPLSRDLYRTARRLTRSHPDAEDLVQVTMLKAYAAFGSFRQDSNLRAWLTRIMYNAWMGNYRAAQRRPAEVLFAELAESSAGLSPAQFTQLSCSAESEALLAIPDQRIVWALGQLPSATLEVLCYADLYGYRYREIADIMQTPFGTVMSRLHRGRRRLRDLLAPLAQEHGYDNDPVVSARRVPVLQRAVPTAT